MVSTSCGFKLQTVRDVNFARLCMNVFNVMRSYNEGREIVWAHCCNNATGLESDVCAQSIPLHEAVSALLSVHAFSLLLLR